jgi:hypothetical protein
MSNNYQARPGKIVVWPIFGNRKVNDNNKCVSAHESPKTRIHVILTAAAGYSFFLLWD